MPKQFSLNPMAQAIALALNAGFAGMIPIAAQADLTTVQSVPVTATASRVSTIDANNILSEGAVNSVAGTGQLPLFPPSLGVLTGVQIDLAASTLIQTMQFDAQWLTQSTGSQMAVTDSVQPLISISTPTATNLPNLVGPSSSMGLVCNAFPTLLCQVTSNLLSNADFTASASAPLAPYVGETGTVTGVVNANFSPLQLTPPEIGTLNSATITETAKLDGSFNVTYSYLNHAQPVVRPDIVENTTLNFGTVLQGSNAPSQKWRVVNVGTTPNVGLDLIGATSVNPKLDLGITQPLIGLDAGLFQVFNATLDTAQPGNAASYQLAFSDSAKGALNSLNSYQMTLNVTGNVVVRKPSLIASSLMTGFHPAAPVSADFNGDGKPDMLVLDRDNKHVVGYQGNPLGGIDNKIAGQTSVGNNPVALAVGDINNDGKPDAVVANFGDNTVSVLLGQSGFIFQASTTVPAGNGPIDVALHDLNRDGKLDMVVADISDNTVQVMLGDGGGKFNTGTAFAAGSSPYGLAVGDLNRDGKPDVAVTNPGSNQVSVLLGNGNGLLQVPLSFAVGLSPLALTMADVSGDGKPDLVTANHGSDNLSVLRGTGGKGLFAPATTVALPVGSGPSKVTTADINKDGHPDLVVSNGNTNTLAVLANKGTGTFAAPVTVPVGAQPGGIAVADLNSDSKPDLVVANTAADTSLSVALNTTVVAPSGKFVGRSDSTLVTSGTSLWAMAMGDFNRDGRSDLVLADNALRKVFVYLGKGDGRFQFLTAYVFNVPFNSVAAGDVNGDGKLDLAVTGRSAKGVLLGLGDGRFQAIKLIANAGGLFYNFATLGDVNRDGKLDFIAESDNGVAVEVSLGKGDGSFNVSAKFATQAKSGALLVASVAMGDINGDGKMDLAATTVDTVSVLLGNGDGSFQPGKVFPLAINKPKPLKFTNLALGDVNGDGKLDLAVANNSTQVVNVLLGIGDGNFQPPVAYATGVNSTQLAMEDVNGDGKPDIAFVIDASGQQTQNNLGVLIGNGNGSFQPMQAYAVGNTLAPFSIVLGDMNGDSRPDLAISDRSQSSVSILLNRAP